MDTTTAPTNPPSAPVAAGTQGAPQPDGLGLAPGRWELDTNHSSVGFAIRHLGVSKVRGAFRDVTAELVVPGPGEVGRLEVDIALASIDTGNADRDAHVRTSDLLDVELRPTMRFVATGVRGDRERFELAGNLTIGDVTRPITLDVEFGGLEVFPADGRRHAGFEATGEIRRREFGLDAGLLAGPFLGDVVKVELDVQFVEPALEDGAA
jgi:polyisoprenoid-binding protein YceI